MSAMSSAVRMAANMSMKVRVDAFTSALRIQFFSFCAVHFFLTSLFLCAPPPPPICKIREANQRSMCTQYSPNLSSNHRHASFAPTLSEIPTSLGTLYIARVVIRAVSEFFFLRRGHVVICLWIKWNERDLMHFSIARVAARFAYPFEIENHFRENLPF